MNDSADLYSIINLSDLGPHPVKDLSVGLDKNFPAGNYLNSFLDYFDPGFQNFLASYFSRYSGAQPYRKKPWIVGVTIGSADQFYGIGAGPDFDTTPAGHNSSDLAYMTLIAPPIQTFNSSTSYSSKALAYADPLVYSKVGLASPPSNCSLATPCTLRDFLFKKYGGKISALNAAWGSNYTTFDSSGGCVGYSFALCNGGVPSETFGAGDGRTVSFSHTFAHSPVSSSSVQILVNGAVVGGDCPANRYYGTLQCPAGTGTGALRGATISSSGSAITYKSGVATIVFSAPPAGGAAIKVNYISGGWGIGTGLMDEDGRNTSWLGSNAVCVRPVADANTPGTASYACRKGNPARNPAPNANANFAADITAWDAQFAAQYFSSVRSAFKSANPNLLLFSPETTGTWDAPPAREILQAANQYSDVLFTVAFTNQPTPSVGQQKYLYYTQYFAGPMFNLAYLTACQDSATAEVENSTCQNVFHQASQAARGQQWETTIQNMLTQPSFNNTYQWVGISWWQLHDNDGPDNPVNNWGLKTANDNAYDGHEAVKASVPCSPPLEKLTCGGEKKEYGDLITPVKRANKAWIEKAANDTHKSAKPN